MGFHIETAEIKELLDSYKQSSSKTTASLDKAKTAMNGIITSNSMYGEVGKAIASDINNHQNATIVGLRDVYELLGSDMEKTYQSFKSTTGEHSDSAILDQSALEKAKKDLNNFKLQHNEIRKKTKNVYQEIADLVDLEQPSGNSFDEKHDNATKFLDKIVTDVSTFESGKGSNQISSQLQAISKDIQSASNASSLSYTDPQFLSFANETAYADGIVALNTKWEKQKREQQKAKEKEISKMSQEQMIAKYGKDDPVVQKRINYLSSQISATSIGLEYSNDLIQSTNTEFAKQFFDKNGQQIANSFYASSAKYAGSELGSALYVGGKAVSKAGSAIPMIGPAIDAITLVGSHDPNAPVKFTGHLMGNAMGDVVGTVATAGTVSYFAAAGSVFGTAIPIPIVGTLVGLMVGTLVGYAVNKVIDYSIDETSKNFSRREK